MSGGVVGHLGHRMADLGGGVLSELEVLQTDFLAGFTRELQRQPERVLDLNELVVKVTFDWLATTSAVPCWTSERSLVVRREHLASPPYASLSMERRCLPCCACVLLRFGGF